MEVERVIDTRLRGRPVIVAAQAASRATVYDMSEEAFQAGVRKGAPLQRARRVCRDAVVIPPRLDHYERAMQVFQKHVLPYSPLVEPGEGNGHLFIDLSGTGRLFGPPADVAWRIRKAVRADLGLDPIWSVSPNKLVSKVASRLVKPTGEYIVEPGEEQAFLSPLPLHLLPGIERDDLLCFREFHISRVNQAIIWTPEQLDMVFGRRGGHIHRVLRGIDPSPVMPVGRKPAAVTGEHDFGDDTNDIRRVDAVLFALVEQAGFQLRERGMVARRSVIQLDYSDGVRIIRQKSDAQGTAIDFRLYQMAHSALDLAWKRRVRLRRLQLICDRLTDPPCQMSLFPEEQKTGERSETLLTALDRIRVKFGREAIRLGRTLAADDA